MEKENSTLNLSALPDLLGKALSSPEIMSAVASLLAMLREPQSPPQAAQSELLTEQAEPLKDLPEENAESAEVMALLPSRPPFSSQKRQMLSAIRPYMSERRCQMIDRMVHAADLVQLLKR